jgi:hypothetical protein
MLAGFTPQAFGAHQPSPNAARGARDSQLRTAQASQNAKVDLARKDLVDPNDLDAALRRGTHRAELESTYR